MIVGRAHRPQFCLYLREWRADIGSSTSSHLGGPRGYVRLQRLQRWCSWADVAEWYFCSVEEITAFCHIPAF